MKTFFDDYKKKKKKTNEKPEIEQKQKIYFRDMKNNKI